MNNLIKWAEEHKVATAIINIILWGSLIALLSHNTIEEDVAKAVRDKNAQVTLIDDVVTGGDAKIVQVETNQEWGGIIGYQDIMAKAIEKIFDKRKEVSEINIIMSSTLVDNRGNESVKPVARVKMTRANANTVNWDSFDIRELPNVADDYWQHKLFKN